MELYYRAKICAEKFFCCFLVCISERERERREERDRERERGSESESESKFLCFSIYTKAINENITTVYDW